MIGKPLVDTTYILEGDGPTACIAYELLCSIKSEFDLHHDELTYPLLQPAIDEYELSKLSNATGFLLGSRPAMRLSTIQSLKSFTDHSRDYFMNTIWTGLKDDLTLYAAARWVDPDHLIRADSYELFGSAIKCLKYFTTPVILGMLSEYGTYLALCHNHVAAWKQREVKPNESAYKVQLEGVMLFWESNYAKLPKLSEWARYVFSLPTSSAAVERLFSMLKLSFNSLQNASLEDYIKLALILRYNGRDA